MNYNAACVVHDPNASIGVRSEETTPTPGRERETRVVEPATMPVPEDQDQDWDTDVTTQKILAGIEDNRHVVRSTHLGAQSSSDPSQGYPRFRLESAFDSVAQSSLLPASQLPPQPPTLFGQHSSFSTMPGELLAPLSNVSAASYAAPLGRGGNPFATYAPAHASENLPIQPYGGDDWITIRKSEYDRLLLARQQTERFANIIEDLEIRLHDVRAMHDQKQILVSNAEAAAAQKDNDFRRLIDKSKDIISRKESELAFAISKLHELSKENENYGRELAKITHLNKVLHHNFSTKAVEVETGEKLIIQLKAHIAHLQENQATNARIAHNAHGTHMHLHERTQMFDIDKDPHVDAQSNGFDSCQGGTPDEKINNILSKYSVKDSNSPDSTHVVGNPSGPSVFDRVSTAFSVPSRIAAAVSSAGQSVMRPGQVMSQNLNVAAAAVSSAEQSTKHCDPIHELDEFVSNLSISDPREGRVADKYQVKVNFAKSVDFHARSGNVAAVSSAGHSITNDMFVFGKHDSDRFSHVSNPIGAAVSSAGHAENIINFPKAIFHDGAAVSSAGHLGIHVTKSSNDAAVSSAGHSAQTIPNKSPEVTDQSKTSYSAPGDDPPSPEKDDGHKRRDKADNIDLDPMPLPNELRKWKTDLYEKVANAYFIDTDKAFTWISAVSKATCIEDLQENTLPALEAKLSNAVMKSIKRDTVFKQKVDKYISDFHLKGLRLRSRQIIWLMFDYLKPREIGEGVYDLKDLMSVELHADHRKCNLSQLENFLLRWETCLTGMKREPDEDTKLTLFKKQVENIELLDYDMQIYKRLRDPAQKSYSFLQSACQNLIDLHRLEENQRQVHRSTRRSQTPVRAAPAPQRGRSRSPSRTHKKRDGHDRSKSRSNSTGSKKGFKSKSPGSKSGRKKVACYDFIKNRCNRGAGCRYSHSPNTIKAAGGDRKRSNSPSHAKSGSKSLSPASKKKIPCTLHAKGSCKYGDKCYYLHATLAAPATSDANHDRKNANSPIPNESGFP